MERSQHNEHYFWLRHTLQAIKSPAPNLSISVFGYVRMRVCVCDGKNMATHHHHTEPKCLHGICSVGCVGVSACVLVVITLMWRCGASTEAAMALHHNIFTAPRVHTWTRCECWSSRSAENDERHRVYFQISLCIPHTATLYACVRASMPHFPFGMRNTQSCNAVYVYICVLPRACQHIYYVCSSRYTHTHTHNLSPGPWRRVSALGAEIFIIMAWSE